MQYIPTITSILNLRLTALEVAASDIHILFHELFKVDSEGRLRMKLYDERDDFNFPSVNFPFMRSTIPAAPADGVYISLRYSRACGSYQDFLDRGCCLHTRY
jgi:hypothetical protein